MTPQKIAEWCKRKIEVPSLVLIVEGSWTFQHCSSSCLPSLFRRTCWISQDSFCSISCSSEEGGDKKHLCAEHREDTAVWRSQPLPRMFSMIATLLLRSMPVPSKSVKSFWDMFTQKDYSTNSLKILNSSYHSDCCPCFCSKSWRFSAIEELFLVYNYMNDVSNSCRLRSSVVY